jgi:hypothetical protein
MWREGEGQPQDPFSLVPVRGISPPSLAVWGAADWAADLEESVALYDARSPGPVRGSPAEGERGPSPSGAPHPTLGAAEGVVSAGRAG